MLTQTCIPVWKDINKPKMKPKQKWSHPWLPPPVTAHRTPNLDTCLSPAPLSSHTPCFPPALYRSTTLVFAFKFTSHPQIYSSHGCQMIFLKERSDCPSYSTSSLLHIILKVKSRPLSTAKALCTSLLPFLCVPVEMNYL